MDDSLNETQFNTIGALSKGAFWGGVSAMTGAGVPMSLLSAVMASGILKDYGKPQTGNNAIAAINQFAKDNNKPQNNNAYIVDYTANFTDTINVLKGMNKSFITMINRIENTNAILEKILGVQTGQEPIDIMATIKRNNRMALAMSRTAMGRLTLSLMTKAMANANTRQQNLAHQAIESQMVNEDQYMREGLIRRLGERFESLRSLTDMFSQNIEGMNETILQQKATYTQETNTTIIQVIPSRLQAIGSLIARSNEHLSSIQDIFEAYFSLSMMHKEDSEKNNMQLFEALNDSVEIKITDPLDNINLQQFNFYKESVEFYQKTLEILNNINDRIYKQEDRDYFPVKIIGKLFGNFNGNFDKKILNLSVDCYNALGGRISNLNDNKKLNKFESTSFTKNKEYSSIKNNEDIDFSEYQNNTLSNILNSTKDKKGKEKNFKDKNGNISVSALVQYTKEIKKANEIEAIEGFRKKEKYEQAQSQIQSQYLQQIQNLNETAISIYGQQVKYGNFLYKYLTNIPNILTRVLNTALKFYLGLRFTKMIYQGIRWAFGISKNIKDGIFGFFNKLVDSNASQLTAGSISIYDRIMKFIFGEKYKDHKDLANNVEKNGLLKSIGLFLIDQIKKGFQYLWDSGMIMSAIKYYVLFSGAKEIIGTLPGLVTGIFSTIGTGILNTLTYLPSHTWTRLFFGGGIMLFFGKFFTMFSGLLSFVFKHAKTITFVTFLIKHMFDNWFASLEKNIQNQFSELNLGEKIVYTIKYMFYNLWEWIKKTDTWKIIDEYMGYGLGHFVTNMWDLFTKWLSNHLQEILIFSIASSVGTVASGHPLIASLLGLGTVWGYDAFFGDNKISKWISENFGLTKKYNDTVVNTDIAKAKENSTTKNLLLGTKKITDTLVEMKETTKNILKSTENIKDSISSSWKIFKKKFIDTIGPMNLGAITGGFRNFFDNIGSAIAPESFKTQFETGANEGQITIDKLLKAANLEEKYKDEFVGGALVHKELLEQFIDDIQKNRSNENVAKILKEVFNINGKNSFEMLTYELSKFNTVQTNFSSSKIASILEKEKVDKRDETLELIQGTGEAISNNFRIQFNGTVLAIEEIRRNVSGIYRSLDVDNNSINEINNLMNNINLSHSNIPINAPGMQEFDPERAQSKTRWTVGGALAGAGILGVGAALASGPVGWLALGGAGLGALIGANANEYFNGDATAAEKYGKRHEYGINQYNTQKKYIDEIRDRLKNQAEMQSKGSNMYDTQAYLHDKLSTDDIKNLGGKKYLNNITGETKLNDVNTNIGSFFNQIKFPGSIYEGYDRNYLLDNHKLLEIYNNAIYKKYSENHKDDDTANTYMKGLYNYIATILRTYQMYKLIIDSILEIKDARNYVNARKFIENRSVIADETSNIGKLFKVVAGSTGLINPEVLYQTILGNILTPLNGESIENIFFNDNLNADVKKKFDSKIGTFFAEVSNIYGALLKNLIEVYNYDLNSNDNYNYSNSYNPNWDDAKKKFIIFIKSVAGVDEKTGKVFGTFLPAMNYKLYKSSGLNEIITDPNGVDYYNKWLNPDGSYKTDTNGNILFFNQPKDETIPGDPQYIQFTNNDQLRNIGNYEHYNKLNWKLKNNLENYAKDFYFKYGKKVQLTSGYRSFDEQSYLYNKQLTGQLDAKLAPPSLNNRHLKGLAADISLNSIDQQLLSKNGLIQPDMDDPYHIELKSNKPSYKNQSFNFNKNNNVSLQNQIGDRSADKLNINPSSQKWEVLEILEKYPEIKLIYDEMNKLNDDSISYYNEIKKNKGLSITKSFLNEKEDILDKFNSDRYVKLPIKGLINDYYGWIKNIKLSDHTMQYTTGAQKYTLNDYLKTLNEIINIIDPYKNDTKNLTFYPGMSRADAYNAYKKAIDESILRIQDHLNKNIAATSKNIEKSIIVHNPSAVSKEENIASRIEEKINNQKQNESTNDTSKEISKFFSDISDKDSRYRLGVDKDNYLLYLFKGKNLIKNYPITLGKNIGAKSKEGDMKTPEGNFHIISLENSSNRLYDYHDGKGPVNAFGPYFMRLEIPKKIGSRIGIQGTTKPEEIGYNASSGCIRLKNEDIKDLKNIMFPNLNPKPLPAPQGINIKKENLRIKILPNKKITSPKLYTSSSNSTPENETATTQISQGWKDFYKNGYIPFNGEKDWYKYIVEAGLETGIDPALLGAVIMTESSGNLTIPSKTGQGYGLFQLHQEAQDDVHHLYSKTKSYNRMDPTGKGNIFLGAHYLKAMRDIYGKRYGYSTWKQILTAYNAGPSKGNINTEYANRVFNHYKKRYFVHPDSPLDPNIETATIDTLNGTTTSTTTTPIDAIIQLNNGQKLSKEDSEKYLRWWTFIKEQLKSYGYDNQTLSSWSLINQQLINDKFNSKIKYKGKSNELDLGSEGHFLKLNPILRKRIIDYAKQYGPLQINSSYRSRDEQATLYRWAEEESHGMKKGQAAAPDRSLHQLGMAIDITPLGKQQLDDNLLKKFKLHRPIKGETWHIEPIESASYNKTYNQYGGFPEMLEKNILDSNIYGLKAPENKESFGSGFFKATGNILSFFIELIQKAWEKIRSGEVSKTNAIEKNILDQNNKYNNIILKSKEYSDYIKQEYKNMNLDSVKYWLNRDINPDLNDPESLYHLMPLDQTHDDIVFGFNKYISQFSPESEDLISYYNYLQDISKLIEPRNEYVYTSYKKALNESISRVKNKIDFELGANNVNNDNISDKIALSNKNIKKVFSKAPIDRNRYYQFAKTPSYTSKLDIPSDIEQVGDPFMSPMLFNNTSKYFNSTNDLYDVGDPVYNASSKSFDNILSKIKDGVLSSTSKPSTIHYHSIPHRSMPIGEIEKRIRKPEVIVKNGSNFAGIADEVFQNQIDILTLASKQNAAEIKNAQETRIQNIEDELKDVKMILKNASNEFKSVLKGFAESMSSAVNNTVSSVGNIVNNTVTNLSNSNVNANNSIANNGNNSSNNDTTLAVNGNFDAFLCF